MAHIKKLVGKETWKQAVQSPKKKDWTEVTASVIIDVLAGVVGGGGGAFLGSFAVPTGIALSATGHATGHRWLTAMGIGCIASPFDPFKAEAHRTSNPKFDLKAEMEAGKDRMKDYVEMLKEKFFINKLKKTSVSTDTTTESDTVSGLDAHVGKATLDALTEFDQQIMSEGVEYQARQSSPDNGAGMSGVEELEHLPHII
ncbi:MAG TPA: hypothetical protein VK826_00220 [Bacteroidia bacterium]|nr:hypothetical protein [Bacteroidia bacterium]